jgi:hypothetical protein
MSKWNKREEQSTEINNSQEENKVEDTTIIEQSTELVEGAETVQEPDAEGAETPAEQEEQSTAPVMQVTMGIGQFCRYMMLNSKKSNTEILNAVLAIYPDAKTTPACIAWYKTDLRKKGLLPAGSVVRSTKLVELSAEQLAQLCK